MQKYLTRTLQQSTEGAVPSNGILHRAIPMPTVLILANYNSHKLLLLAVEDGL
jgi:hypothetical protein